jgi:hypothetical protein
MNQRRKLLVEWEVMWKPLFFQVNKEYIFGKTNILKFKKGILRNFKAIEGLNTSN